jgi:hypothetical protein
MLSNGKSWGPKIAAQDMHGVDKRSGLEFNSCLHSIVSAASVLAVATHGTSMFRGAHLWCWFGRVVRVVDGG